MGIWTPLLEELAARTGGLILTRDLRLAGVGEDAIRTVTRGLYRVCRGAYALEPPVDEWAAHRLYARAVALRHRRYVAVSHVSAAVLLEMPLWHVDLRSAHITGLRNSRRGFRHGVHTYEGPVSEEDAFDLDGIQVTTSPRTVLDCARVLPFDRAVAIADHALHTGTTTLEELTHRCVRLPAVAGVDTARRLLTVVDGRAESPGESRSRLIVTDAGIAVEPQVDIYDRDGTFVARVDLLAVEAPLVIEFDGRAKYSLNGNAEEAHWQEKLRQHALEDAGYVVVRLTWAELARPEHVIAKVRRGLARAKQLARA